MLRIRPVGLKSARLRRKGWQSVQDRKKRIVDLFFLLSFLMIINIFLLMLAEDLSFQQAVWLTMSTITTVGYGDLSAQTLLGQLVTIVLMYIFGIFLLAQIAGEWIDFRIDRNDRMQKGLWRWKMSNHIVIINVPEQNGHRYLKLLVEQIRNSANFEYTPVQVVTDIFPEGLPEELSALNILLHQQSPEMPGRFEEVDIEKAAHVLVLASNVNDLRSDSVTLDILDQLKAYSLKAYVIAECIQDGNRERLKNHGAHAVIRPVRAYPELLVRAMAAPGSETILENLFRHEGDHPRRYDLRLSGETWGQLAGRFILSGLGTPLGYLDQDGEVISNPEPEQEVNGKGIFLMVSHHKIPAQEDVLRCVENAG